MTVKRSHPDTDQFCKFPFADGRQCRMLRHPSHSTLCIFHSRQERQILEAETIGEDLAESLSGHFTTAGDVNFVLGKLFAAVAKNRIPPRNASTLAYIGHLLLKSVSPIKTDIHQTYGSAAWEDFVRDAYSPGDEDSELESDSPKSEPAQSKVS
jgi:hypothetical protein